MSMAMVREQLQSKAFPVRITSKVLHVQPSHALSAAYRRSRCRAAAKSDFVEVRIRPASDKATRMRLR